jgi:hypothetical protein
LRFIEKSGHHFPRMRAVLHIALLTALSSACQARGTSDQDTRPLPAPEPPPTNAPLPAAPPDEAAPRRTTPRSSDPSAPRPTEPEQPSPTQPAAAADAGAPAAPKPEGATQAPSAECVQKCQGAMQGCLSTAPADGGVPGFSNVDVCKKAFETCQSSCAK